MRKWLFGILAILVALDVVALAIHREADSHTERVDLMARPATLNPDGTGAWGTWARPRAIYHSDTESKTYLGWISRDGSVKAVEYDHATNAATITQLLGSFSDDDHASPVLRVCDDGKLQYLYTKHNGPLLRWRKSSAAEDASAFATEQTEDFSVASPSFSYPNVMDLSDRVVLTLRQGNASDADQILTELTDDGDTWSSYKMLVDGNGQSAYMMASKHPTNADRIDYYVSRGNPNTVDSHVYHFYRDGTSFYDSGGSLITTLAALDTTPGNAIAVGDMTEIWDGTTNSKWGWVWDAGYDSSNNPIILFATGAGSTGHEMRYSKYSGGSWSSVKIDDVGDSIVGATQIHYSAGAGLDPSDDTTVYISVEDGGSAEIREYTTNDGGSTWDSGTAITRDYHLNMRPIVPQNRVGGLKLLYMRGDYTTLDDFHTQIIGHADSDPSTGAGTISRDTSGEVVTYYANSADNPLDADDWEEQTEAVAVSVRAGDGGLEHSGTDASGWHFVRCTAGASRGERMVQDVHMSTPLIAPALQIWWMSGGHMETGSSGDQICGYQSSVDRSTELLRGIQRTGSGSPDDVDTQSVNAKEVEHKYRHSVYLNGTSITAYGFFDDVTASLTASTYSSGWSGIGGNEVDDLVLYEFFDCTEKNLTCSGLSTGDKLQLRNALGLVIAEATESSGTATIDMTEVVIPEINDLVVVDSGDSLLGGLTLAGSGDPMEYARGGDTYSFVGGGPTTGTLTALFSAFVKDEGPPPKVNALGVQFNAFITTVAGGDDPKIGGVGRNLLKRFSGRHIGKPT